MSVPPVHGFEVEELVSRSRDGAVYRVSQPSGGRGCLREIGLGEESVPTELQDRFERLQRLRHSGLAAVQPAMFRDGRCWILQEEVPGPSLETVARWHQGPLLRRQVLAWAEDVTEVLLFLKSSLPFEIPGIELDHFRVGEDGRLKLVNLGWRRLLEDPPTPADPGYLGQAERLFRALCGEIERRGERLPGIEWILTRRYRHLGELREALHQAAPHPSSDCELLPPEEADVPVPPPPRPFFSLARRRAARRMALELLVLVGLIAALLAPEPQFAQPEEPVYAASGRQVVVLDALRRVLAGRLRFPSAVLDVVALESPPALLIALQGRREVLMVRPTSGRVLARIPTVERVDRLCLDAQAGRLYLVHRAAALVSAIDLQDLPSDGRVLRRTERAFPGGRDLCNVAVLRQGGRTFLLVRSRDRLQAFAADTGKPLRAAVVPGDGEVTVEPSTGRVFVLGATGVAVLWGAELRRLGILAVKAKPSVPLVTSEGRFWCLCGKRACRADPIEPVCCQVLTLPGVPRAAVAVDGELWIALRDQVAIVDSRSGRTLSMLSLEDDLTRLTAPVPTTAALSASDFGRNSRRPKVPRVGRLPSGRALHPGLGMDPGRLPDVRETALGYAGIAPRGDRNARRYL
ncbi:MAG: hypothetical protein HY319_05915 [Armatimonadetes bacterium]|nr:hypothetical protein [Armatimonadota bacterium]